MILESILLEGFRCFDRPVRLEGFGPGLNILSGPNGAGKSTVLRGLRHALLDSHATTGAAVRELMQPWGRALSPRFEVVFRHGGERWRVEKQFLQSPRARLDRDEQGAFRPVAEGSAAVAQLQAMFAATAPQKGLATEAHLGLHQVLWSPQGPAAEVDWSQGVRAAVEESLGAVVASPRGRAIEAEVRKAYLEFFTNGGKYRECAEERRLPALRDALRDARAAWSAASARAEELVTLRRRLGEEASAMAAAEAARRAAEERVAGLAGIREKLANGRTAESEARQEYQALSQILDAWQQGQAAEQRLTKELERNAALLAGARAELAALAERKGRMEAMAGRLEKLEQQGTSAKEWHAAAPARLIVTAETPLDVELPGGGRRLLAGETAEFPGDGVRLPGVASIRVEGGAVRERLLQRWPEWAETPPDLEALRSSYKAARAALDTERSAYEKAASAAEKQTATAEAMERQWSKDLDAVREKLIRTPAAPDLAARRDHAALRHAGARAAVAALEKELADAGGDPEPAARAAAEAERLGRARLEQTRQEAARLEGQLELTSAQNLYGQLAEAEEQLEQASADAGRYRRRALALERLHRSISESSAELAKALPARLADSATAIWSQIAGGGSLVISPQWKAEAAHVPAAHLSGGEAEQVAFATRLALARHLANPERQLAVFDDSFLATDSARAEAIAGILRAAAERLQILILTCHPERYEGLAEAVRLRLEPRP